MSSFYADFASCSSPGLSGSPPAKPMMTIPTKAPNIPNISNRESFSYSQQYARTAVVKMLELKTTRKIPRGINPKPAIRKKTPIAQARLLTQTALRIRLGIDENKVSLKKNLTMSPDKNILTKDCKNVTSNGFTPRPIYKSLKRIFDVVRHAKTQLQRMKTFLIDMSFFGSAMLPLV